MAANTDNLMKVGLASATTLDSNYTINDTTVTVASTAGWPSDTGVTFAIDVIDSQGVQVAGTYNEYVGTVATGTSISNVDWADGNADRNYTAGATTRVYIPVSKTRENRIVTWGLVEHSQAGVHALTSNSTLTSSKVITGLNDTNGNELLKVTATGSAVNELTLANAATGNAPVLSATGGDTNIDMTLTPKGTGYVNLNYTGAPVQTVSVNYSAVATGTTVIPEDDTIPQNTEGTEFMTLSITPKSATNILVVESITYLSCSVTSSLVAALFKDSGADALAVGQNFMSTATGRVTIPVRHAVVAGSTSAQTFKIRGGSTSAGTTTFNGSAGNRQYGATTKSSITITEYKAS